eukprot:SAG22_NODE_4549_length_1237_cov_7.152900_2_plen_118_part_00
MLNDEFSRIDADNSGTLGFDEIVELAATLASRSGVVPPKRNELEAAFREMDADDSGEVEFAEFSEWWAAQKGKKAMGFFGSSLKATFGRRKNAKKVSSKARSFCCASTTAVELWLRQ